jgi:phosphohistidine phosphatase
VILYLLRHAKSSWEDPDLDDHERPLAPRGERAGRAMARYVREHRIDPELVICSTAQRARMTLDLVADGFPEPAPRVKLDRAVYEADADELLAMLRGVPPATSSAMLVGHQPAIGDLARLLVGADERLAGKFPTGALAILEDEEWAALGPGGAELRDLVKPKRLPAEASGGDEADQRRPGSRNSA